jgi:hypothetical protein
VVFDTPKLVAAYSVAGLPGAKTMALTDARPLLVQ